MGVHLRTVAAIESFFHHRIFQVRVNICISSIKGASSGVPQAEALLPLLFIIYANDLPLEVERLGVSCKLFADDVKVFSSDKWSCC